MLAERNPLHPSARTLRVGAAESLLMVLLMVVFAVGVKVAAYHAEPPARTLSTMHAWQSDSAASLAVSLGSLQRPVPVPASVAVVNTYGALSEPAVAAMTYVHAAGWQPRLDRGGLANAVRPPPVGAVL